MAGMNAALILILATVDAVLVYLTDRDFQALYMAEMAFVLFGGVFFALRHLGGEKRGLKLGFGKWFFGALAILVAIEGVVALLIGGGKYGMDQRILNNGMEGVLTASRIIPSGPYIRNTQCLYIGSDPTDPTSDNYVAGATHHALIFFGGGNGLPNHPQLVIVDPANGANSVEFTFIGGQGPAISSEDPFTILQAGSDSVGWRYNTGMGQDGSLDAMGRTLKNCVIDSSCTGGTGSSAINDSGSFYGTGSSTKSFTVSIVTQPSSTYKVNVIPTSAVAAAPFYVSSKTTTAFVVTYVTAVTGSETFDWTVCK